MSAGAMNTNLGPRMRVLVAASLLIFAVLSVTWVLLLPDSPADAEESLRAVADAGTTGRIALIALAASQLAFLVGFAGVAVWLHRTSPRLATLGGTCVVLGGFGHAVFSGAEMVRHTMADDPAGNADLASRIQTFGPLIPFMAAGLIGTVLGLILLGAAHLRATALPRWVGPVLIAFVLVEFVGSNFSDWAGYLSGVLLLAACGGLAVGVMTSAPAPDGAVPVDLATAG